jgi:hypothetical protein
VIEEGLFEVIRVITRYTPSSGNRYSKEAQDKFDTPIFEIRSINCENENAPKRIKDINNRLFGWRISRKKDMHHG